MMVNLDDITINASTQPTRAWNLNDRDWVDYKYIDESYFSAHRFGHVPSDEITVLSD